MLQRLTSRLSDGLDAVLQEDSPSLLTRGYDFGERIWRRARPGARSARCASSGTRRLRPRSRGGGAVLRREPHRPRRRHAGVIREPLFGHGSVHALDGAAHRHRKATFVEAAYEDAQVERLTPFLEREWAAELEDWRAGGTRTAYDAAVGAFGRAMMRWAGLPGTAAAHTRWAARLAQIVDGFGAPYSPPMSRPSRTASSPTAMRDASSKPSAPAICRPRGHGTRPVGRAPRRDRGAPAHPGRRRGAAEQHPPDDRRRAVRGFRREAVARSPRMAHSDRRRDLRARGPGRGTLATMFAQEVRRTGLFVPMLPGRTTTEVEIEG